MSDGRESLPIQPVEILYRDAHLLAVNKPARMLVHRGPRRSLTNLVDRVRALLGGGRDIRPMHRLDYATSGVVLFALDRPTASALNAAFRERLVAKRYLALVRGEIRERGLVERPLCRTQGGTRRPAVTAFRRLAAAATEPRHTSLVEVVPHTGRFHQIRRHFSYVSYPVVGDTKHGHLPLNRALRDRYGLGRLALHALELQLVHPARDEPLTLRAPPPVDLREPFERMGYPASVWQSLREEPTTWVDAIGPGDHAEVWLAERKAKRAAASDS